LSVEGPLRFVGAITLLESCLAGGNGSWQLACEHVMRPLATLHESLIADLVVNSVPDISARGADAFIGDPVTSEATKCRCISPWIRSKLVAVGGALKPKGVAVECCGHIGCAKLRLIDRLFLVLA